MKEEELQKKIEDYIDAIEELEKNPKTTPSLEENRQLFRKVMENMGLSPAEQEQLAQKGQDFVARAKSHYAEGDFAHSRNLAQKAEKLLPFDVTPKDVLLQIYVHTPLQDPQKARIYARNILQLAPRHPFAKKVLPCFEYPLTAVLGLHM